MSTKIALLLQKAVQDIQGGNFEAATLLLNDVLEIEHEQVDAIRLLGVIAALQKDWHEALQLINQVIQLHPQSGVAHSNQGNILLELGKLEEALLSYEKAIALEPLYAEAHNNQGNVYQRLGRFSKAIECYEKALSLQPDYADADVNRGNALQHLGCYQDALKAYEKAVQKNPNCAAAYFGVARLFLIRKQYSDAMGCCDQALKIHPEYEDALALKGAIFYEVKDYANAIAAYDQVLANNENSWEALICQGNIYSEMKEFEKAHKVYERALDISPTSDFLLGTLMQNELQMCDWDAVERRMPILLEGVRSNKRVAIPYNLISTLDDRLLIKRSIELYAQSLTGDIQRESQRISHNKKIRLGYFSADFHNHPTAYLVAELFECHNKEEYELIAFVFGRNTADEMRARLEKSFDQFIDISNMSDEEAAKLSREMGIDIAVDLKGFTKEARPRIFMYGAAPIQVSYLAFPGTMGLQCFDYVIADPVVVPKEMQDGFVEKIIYMPNSYQVNDRSRKIASEPRTKKELGLPENGFIYCCFNNNYKILPTVMDSWMKILSEVDDSVLWLYEDNPFAAANLKKEAKFRGVDPNRLIFAGRMEPADHLARYKLADLFLDTTPCNAHTTASDALWSGLPVITLAGESFGARVAASLLTAVGLPEMIVASTREYEDLAIEFGKNPSRLQLIKDRLQQNVFTEPLFDTPLFTRHIEMAYKAVFRRHQKGLPPDHIYVA